MNENELNELEAQIIGKLKTKKKPNNAEIFLLLVHEAGQEASKDAVKAYEVLMKDLVQVESLKQEQQALLDGLNKKCSELFTANERLLPELLRLKERQAEDMVLEQMSAEERQAGAEEGQALETRQSEEPL